MPVRPLPTCIHVGCKNRTDGGSLCKEHAGARHTFADALRGSSWDRGYDPRHRGWRKLVLHKDPVCVRCHQAPATIADHILPLVNGGDFSLENGQGLCHACHNQKTHEDRKKPWDSADPQPKRSPCV